MKHDFKFLYIVMAEGAAIGTVAAHILSIPLYTGAVEGAVVVLAAAKMTWMK